MPTNVPTRGESHTELASSRKGSGVDVDDRLVSPGESIQRRAVNVGKRAGEGRAGGVSATCCLVGDGIARCCCFGRLRGALVGSSSLGTIIRHLRLMQACFFIPGGEQGEQGVRGGCTEEAGSRGSGAATAAAGARARLGQGLHGGAGAYRGRQTLACPRSCNTHRNPAHVKPGRYLAVSWARGAAERAPVDSN